MSEVVPEGQDGELDEADDGLRVEVDPREGDDLVDDLEAAVRVLHDGWFSSLVRPMFQDSRLIFV